MREAYVWRVVDGRAVSDSPGAVYDWARVHEPGDAYAVDTETAGIEWNDAVRLVQLGDTRDAWAIRVDTAQGRDLAADCLASSAARLVMHNAPFDAHALQRAGIDAAALWPRIVDTYVMSHVADPKAQHGLKPQSVAHLNADAADEQRELKATMRKHKWTWGTVPLLALIPYAVYDPRLAKGLYDHYRGRLSYTEWSVVEREMEVAACVWGIEERGMHLDVDYARTLERNWADKMTQLRRQIQAFGTLPLGVDDPEGMTNTEWNPNSTAQLAQVLISRGWQPRAFTETGKAKLDQAVLESIRKDYALVDDLLEFRRIQKWRKAYVEACLQAMDSNGRVHASYNTLGAVTGRMSCSRPPLQQLPKGGGGEVRRLFIASEGNVIASVDYSAVEFRLAGALSGEPRIIDVYRDRGDWYQQVANDLKITRPQAKVFCLAILYGARGRRIAQALGFSARAGTRLVNEFWARYPTLHEWSEQLAADAEHGLMPESHWGRTLAPHAPYAAGNAKIQGTAAEVMKDGILRLRDADLLQYVVAIVHDEVVLDVPADNAETLASEVARVLSDAETFACPLVAEAKVYGRSWGDGYAAAA